MLFGIISLIPFIYPPVKVNHAIIVQSIATYATPGCGIGL